MSPNERIDPGRHSPKLKKRRTLTRRLMVGGLLAILTLAGIYYFWFDRPIGKGPAGPVVDRESFQKPWISRPTLLVGIGDSVTAGFGARPKYSYFDLLITNSPDDFAGMQGICLARVLPHFQITNLAISGSTSFEHLEKELPHLAPQDTNTLGIIVMTTGGNDLIHNYGRTPPNPHAIYGATLEQARPWITGFDGRLESMLAKLNSAFPGGCHVFIADIFDPTDSVGDIQRAGLPAWKDGTEILKAYNEVLHQFAERHREVHLVGVHDAFLGHGIHCTQFWDKHYRLDDPHYWYYDNLEDPNERGYDTIRRLFLIEMAKTLPNHG